MIASLLDNYWIVWPVGILIWLVIGWAEFGYFESNAILHPSSSRVTLSYFVYYLSTKFPLSIFWGGVLVGAFFGSLSVHFFWHFCPPGSVSAG